MNSQIVLMLCLAAMAAGFCPREKIHSAGRCSLRVVCYRNITGLRLPDDCMDASNIPVVVEVTLLEATDHNSDGPDQEFLGCITSLRISGRLPQTDLQLLQYTSRLENLYLPHNQIVTITGKPFQTLNYLDVLDLSHNNISEIDRLFTFDLQSNKLRKLYLSHNNIQNLTVRSFAELNVLVELDLSHNAISDLTEEPFSSLTNLQILRLNDNGIINLNGAVNNLQSLRHLYLKGNQIENIDENSLKIINHLETFDVASNHLDRINFDMFSRHWKHLGSRALCKIILSGNHIRSVPNATAGEVNKRYARHLQGRGKNNVDVFTELYLSNNDITSIEYNAFQSLVKLTLLNLSNNKLKSFSVNANDVAYLKYLNLSGNYIDHMNFQSFSRMSNLQNLDLSHNKLMYIPDLSLNNNFNLKHVNMTHNAIEQVDKLRITVFHPDGGVLDLSNNGLSSFTIPYGEGLHLIILILNYNHITDVSLINLRHLTDLKNLDLSHNKITELRENSLQLPVSLNYLDLSCNQIEKIASSVFYGVGHLKTLRLAHNKLKTIEYGIFRGLNGLLNLDLSYNRIGFLDSNLLMDLKSLSVLSMRYNGLHAINDEGWYGHKYDLRVFLDGNNITCEWLARALQNANNGYSKMHPTTLPGAMPGPSLEGIPCIPEGVEMASLRAHSSVMVDERLLMTVQKILDAVKEQTHYMKTFIWHSIQKEEEHGKSFSYRGP